MEQTITVLRGPDRVRKRPAVIFGSEDAKGVMVAFQMLLGVFAREGTAGHSKQITVTQYPDASVEIHADGRGLFLDGVWQDLFCRLYAAAPYPDGSPADGEADSLELCAVQYASAYMDVCVIRDGFRQTLRFEKGQPVGELTKTPCEDAPGTGIRFQPDGQVFSEISLPREELARALQLLALQVPGLQTVFRQETGVGCAQRVFCYPGGAADYLRERNAEAAVYQKELTACGQDRYNRPSYTATVTTGVCFVRDAGFVECCHNGRELTCGGTHCDRALADITRYLEWMLDCSIRREVLLKHLQLVIVTSAQRTCWINGTRTGIDNVLIRDLTQDTLGEDFRYFVKQNRDLLWELFGK